MQGLSEALRQPLSKRSHGFPETQTGAIQTIQRAVLKIRRDNIDSCVINVHSGEKPTVETSGQKQTNTTSRGPRRVELQIDLGRSRVQTFHEPEPKRPCIVSLIINITCLSSMI